MPFLSFNYNTGVNDFFAHTFDSSICASNNNTHDKLDSTTTSPIFVSRTGSQQLLDTAKERLCCTASLYMLGTLIMSGRRV